MKGAAKAAKKSPMFATGPVAEAHIMNQAASMAIAASTPSRARPEKPLWLCLVTLR